MGALEIRRINIPEITLSEVKRYAGIKGDYDGFLPMLDKAQQELLGKIRNSVVYRVFDCTADKDTVDFGLTKVHSSGLSKVLFGCERAIIMCATVGLDFDRAIKKYSVSSPAEALIISALGSERIEALCDAFCDEIALELCEAGCEMTKRFSPGYGDFSLEFQKEVFRLITPEKYIGLTLDEGFIMTPSKSVSAIIGIRKKK